MPLLALCADVSRPEEQHFGDPETRRGATHQWPLGNEDHPQVLCQDEQLVMAWKPPKMSMMRQRGGRPSEFEAWAGYRALPPLLGRGVGAVALLSRHDGAGDDLPAAEASLAVLVQGEPSKEELADAERGPVQDMAVTCASEGLYLGRLSLLEGELRVGTTDREVRRFFADWNHRIIGNGLLCARGAGVRRTFLARVGLRLGNLHARLPPPPSFQRLMQKDHQALQRRLGNKDAAWSGRTEHQAQHVDFDGLALQVPPGVFVPRRSALPSVEAGHELAQATGATRLLDCGTGSGCIALALLRRLPHATVVAIDQDVNAVACARQNAQALGLEERAKVHQMRFDELRDVVDDAGFDLAVSNPPYLPERLMSHVGYARELQSQSVKAFAAGEARCPICRWAPLGAVGLRAARWVEDEHLKGKAAKVAWHGGGFKVLWLGGIDPQF
ncbi:Release factor glutamine methyltransferase (RF MTase) (N5-glutamine methyltransferase PrmC) (Protein-(glutamine-N5) MTase PrmC) (Protein-glutamine N-methyltransferase PrmC) [Durusdinium trenchii]|uniref:Release factor glutamine methyltransferase (RF MTase) (N5-glutamine methyltransferase PrmC) (Protein-(Glutamine-N5) MTase PrmC) (Protein-glutamine N-methyltransferase PrmC) n=1 Tax=Durusdinium trenchii TaxID=1381693 RepID=A0ABP0MJ59_9DINO